MKEQLKMDKKSQQVREETEHLKSYLYNYIVINDSIENGKCISL